MRYIALVARDGVQTAGIMSVDAAVTDAELDAAAARYGWTLDRATYADGVVPYVDTVIRAAAELGNYLATVEDPS